MLNVRQESEFDRGLPWCGETWNFRSVQSCMLESVACVYTNVHLCHLMMVRESGETGNDPRLHLIHSFSSALAQGRGVIWECDTQTRTRLHSHKMRAYDVCWTDLWCRIMNTLHLPLAVSPGASLGSGSIFSLNWVCDAKKPILTAFPPCSLQAAVAVHFSLKWLMYMQITKAWARIQMRETAIRRQ